MFKNINNFLQDKRNKITILRISTFCNLVTLVFLFLMIIGSSYSFSIKTDDSDLKTEVENKVEYYGTNHYTVYFELHKNLYHTNGYVIIKKIIIENNSNKNVFSIKPDINNHYIESIHNNIYNLETKYNIKNNSFFRESFRTAEAMVLSYYKNGWKSPIITKKEILNAKKEM